MCEGLAPRLACPQTPINTPRGKGLGLGGSGNETRLGLGGSGNETRLGLENKEGTKGDQRALLSF